MHTHSLISMTNVNASDNVCNGSRHANVFTTNEVYTVVKHCVKPIKQFDYLFTYVAHSFWWCESNTYMSCQVMCFVCSH